MPASEWLVQPDFVGQVSVRSCEPWHDRAVVEVGQHTEHGDRDVAVGGEILRTVVGSGVDGIAIAGTGGHDEMGAFVEPPQAVIGVRRPVDHYVYRTQPEGARSGPATF